MEVTATCQKLGGSGVSNLLAGCSCAPVGGLGFPGSDWRMGTALFWKAEGYFVFLCAIVGKCGHVVV